MKNRTKSRICKFCNKEFIVSSGNKTPFCSRVCSADWKIENYVPPVIDWKLNNWNVLEFAYRKKITNKTSCINLWKIECKNCKIQSIRYQNNILQDKSCQNCKGKPKGESGAYAIFQAYKNNAINRNVFFDLNFDIFKQLTLSPCHYCGVLPYKSANNGRRLINEWGDYLYNGIDKIIADKGYMVDNVVPCCEMCNFAKSNKSYDRFIEYLDRVAKFYPSSITEPAVNSGATTPATTITGLMGPK